MTSACCNPVVSGLQPYVICGIRAATLWYPQVLDDVDRLLAGEDSTGLSPVLLATLHALLRQPRQPAPADAEAGAAAGAVAGAAEGAAGGAAATGLLRVIGTSSAEGEAREQLARLFDETLLVPLLATPEQAHSHMPHI